LVAILECSDPWGREIELDEEIWLRKIVRSGLRLPEHALDSVRRTIEAPDFVTFDKYHRDGECFYRSHVLPKPLDHLYLKVCVKIIEDLDDATILGRVVTDYPTDRVPKGELPKWP
jgi:hypothetical protein